MHSRAEFVCETRLFKECDRVALLPKKDRSGKTANPSTYDGDVEGPRADVFLWGIRAVTPREIHIYRC
jgi:hypothetical protein